MLSVSFSPRRKVHKREHVESHPMLPVGISVSDFQGVMEMVRPVIWGALIDRGGSASHLESLVDTKEVISRMDQQEKSETTLSTQSDISCSFKPSNFKLSRMSARQWFKGCSTRLSCVASRWCGIGGVTDAWRSVPSTGSNRPSKWFTVRVTDVTAVYI